MKYEYYYDQAIEGLLRYEPGYSVGESFYDPITGWQPTRLTLSHAKTGAKPITPEEAEEKFPGSTTNSTK